MTVALDRAQAVHRRVRIELSLRDRDPLDFWQHSSGQTRRATELLREKDEGLARGPNKGGKTEWQYAAGLAMLQKRPTLDGIPLPQWRGKVEGVSLEIDHEQQKLSSQQTILRLLGRWPHHPSWKGNGVLASLRIQPVNGSSDERTWSTLQFVSQENRRTGTGIRADLVLGNEPPREDIWRELRKAAHAGRRIVRIMCVTPTSRRAWQWIKNDYGDPPRGSTTLHPDWFEVRWSLPDNAALSRAEVEKLLREYGDPAALLRAGAKPRKPDPLLEARVHGDYCDTTGDNPLDTVALNEMLALCVEPELVDWSVTREADSDQGLKHVSQKVVVEVFSHFRGRPCYLNVDPSKGIESDRHDPGGILVCEVGTGDLMAVYEGYIGSYGLGRLAAGLARQYGNAVVDPESNSGWSEGVLRGLADSGYANIARTRKIGRQGKWEERLGFETTVETRPAMFVAIQEWATSWRLGAPYAKCPSAKVIGQLLDLIIDEDGKPTAPSGLHDEFCILWGQQLRKTRPRRVDPNLSRALPKPAAPAGLTASKLLDRMQPQVGGLERMVIPTPRRKPGG